MEESMKFNSQICTTKEQSKRLLTLGLKRETADMCINLLHESGLVHSFSYSEALFLYDNYGLDRITNIDLLLPAWSLHRLIEMCNKIQFGMTISIYNDEVSIDGDLFEVFDNTYDNLISIIEWLIKLGHFKKEYLKQ